jgi:uncharacterized protein
MKHLKAISIIIGKVFVFILIWAGGLACISAFDKTIATFDQRLSTFIFEFFPLVFILIPSFLLWKFLDKRPISELGFRLNNCLSDTSKGLLFGVVWLGICIISLFIFADVKTNIHLSLSVSTLVLYFFFLAFNAAMQELLVRGYIFQIIKNEYGQYVALIVSSLLFLGLHPGAIGAGFMASFNVFSAGIIFGLALMLSNNLWLPIGIHAAWNYLCSVIFGVSKIGIYPSMEWLSVTGSKFITGGVKSIEIGFIVTIANVLLMTYFAIQLSRRKEKGEK